jgi:hypothetical protein
MKNHVLSETSFDDENLIAILELSERIDQKIREANE